MGRGTLILAVGLTSLMATVHADLVRLVDGQSAEGVVLEDSAQQVRICSESDVTAIPRETIATVERVPAVRPAAAVLPPWKVVIGELAARPWATSLEQIPSTVIDEGVLRNVPYRSFRFSGDYELNIYGDPDAPACIEIGMYRELLLDPMAKRQCMAVISALLEDASQREALAKLSTKGATSVVGELTMEVTPPESPDAYGGWWISVYSTALLEKARASASELEAISVPFSVEMAGAPAAATMPSTAAVPAAASGWTAAQMSKARPPAKSTTKPRIYSSGFTRKSGSYSRVSRMHLTHRSSISRSRARRR